MALVQYKAKVLKVFDNTLTPTGTAATTCAEQTFTVAGLETTDYLLAVVPPSQVAGVSPASYRISAKDTLAITFCNPTAATVTAAAGNYKIIAFRP